MIKFKNIAVATLATFMCLTSSMIVHAEDNSEDDHSTNLNYEVEESYKWEAPADIIFTNNIDAEAKGGTVKVLENIIAGDKTLIISIGSSENFKITSAEGVERDYRVKKDSEVLSAGSRVLIVPSGTNDGQQDLSFELQGIITGNLAQQAGTYTGTLNFEATLTSNYRIEYHMDGGTNDPSNPATYEKDSGDINLANPSKEGYTFDGWYTEPEFTNRVTSIVNGTEGNVDLYAKFSATSYTITYVLNGGTNNVSNPSGYDAITLPITLLDPTKNGYTFAGWYETSDFSGSPVTQIDAGTTGNKIFYAKWDFETYTITYELNGGNATNPSSYTAESLPLTLNNPTKDGYTFTGWTGSNGSSPQKDLQITVSDFGNKSYTANWEVKVVAAYFNDGKGGSIGLSWEELKLEENGTKYRYSASAISDTSIGNFSFAGSPLLSLNVPDSVTSIGNNAFQDCTELQGINFSNNSALQIIDSDAFRNCPSLLSINIPNNVTSIGYYAFSSCTGLTLVTIPASVTSISDDAFSNCTGLTSITVSTDNPNYSSENGVLYNKEKTILMKYPAQKESSSFVVPNGVNAILGSAFEGCLNLTSITLPNSLWTTSLGYTAIAIYSFNGCTNLTDITFNGSQDEWRVIQKEYNWDYNTGNYTIHCTDGDIAKS